MLQRRPYWIRGKCCGSMADSTTLHNRAFEGFYTSIILRCVGLIRGFRSLTPTICPRSRSRRGRVYEYKFHKPSSSDAPLQIQKRKLAECRSMDIFRSAAGVLVPPSPGHGGALSSAAALHSDFHQECSCATKAKVRVGLFTISSWPQILAFSRLVELKGHQSAGGHSELIRPSHPISLGQPRWLAAYFIDPLTLRVPLSLCISALDARVFPCAEKCNKSMCICAEPLQANCSSFIIGRANIARIAVKRCPATAVDAPSHPLTACPVCIVLASLVLSLSPSNKASAQGSHYQFNTRPPD